MDPIVHRSSWIVGIVFLLLSVTAGSQPSPALSFEERVECQRRIEEVRWRYTIWPEANPTPKPALSEVLSEEATRSKVEDALRKSSALAEYWQRPITSAQLQAEMERMARGTRHAELLLDLFAALDNDSFLIAECLARPVLSDRLLRNWYAYDERFNGDVGAAAESAMSGGVTASELPVEAEKYEEVTFEHAGVEDEDRSLGERGALRLDAEEWSEALRRLADRFGVGRTAQPQGREFGGAVSERSDNVADEIEVLFAEIPVGEVSALEETVDGWRAVTVLSKSEGSIRLGIAQWPKLAFSMWWAAARDDLAPGVEPLAGAYTLTTVTGDAGCTPDTWRMTGTEAPSRRFEHTAVWTGSRMIVWGGRELSDRFNTGGVYDPGTDSWTPTSVEGAPAARRLHTAVWTGTRMIVWGGYPLTNTGGVYDPTTDTWSPTAVEGAPSGRYGHTAIWTGSRMIVWSGPHWDNTGGLYDPETDTWTPTSTAGAPTWRENHTAIWTGSRMIVWGGSGFPALNTGGVYDPATDTWSPTSTNGAPSAREWHTAVWTGSRMIVWGGQGGGNTGGLYNPTTNRWSPTSTDGAPSERFRHTAVWTGSRMIVWGGGVSGGRTNTGGVYDPALNTWTSTSMDGAPSERGEHTAVWTGSRMIVWGGSRYSYNTKNTGGLYDPVTDTWTATGGAGTRRHTAVWTGSRMIVWGGSDRDGIRQNTGDVYDPATDTWMPTSTEGAPSARDGHDAVWTGSRMIVWGGKNSADYLNTGGQYDPATDNWAATSAGGSPSTRDLHTAVWTGSRMIVWGGNNSDGYLSTGGLYDPAAETWTPTSIEGAPEGRTLHTADWTGNRMIVWGGTGDGGKLNTGGQYDPATGTWTPTTTENAPSARHEHTTVWTGSRMIVWGGIHDVGAENSGGVYDPAANTWTPTSRWSAPLARSGHSAVWTGSGMIIWGGSSDDGRLNTGGLYNLGTDTWTGMTTTGAPAPSNGHTAIWTGSQMIAWGDATNRAAIYCPPVPGSGPRFTQGGCGTFWFVQPSNTVAFPVAAEDDVDRVLVLDSIPLPEGASMSPPIPLEGNPVSSEFSWTTGPDDADTVATITFTATNDREVVQPCEVTIEVSPGLHFSEGPCDTTVFVEPVDMVAFSVTAEDEVDRTLVLDSSALPAGASMSPPLPLAGNPATSNFTWPTTPDDADTVTAVTFTVTNDLGETATCDVTVEVYPGPRFTDGPCGTTVIETPGDTVTFAVTAGDETDRTLVLDSSPLPGRASMTPPLPVQGNPVTSDFTWPTTSADKNTTTTVTFVATNERGVAANCAVTIWVVESTQLFTHDGDYDVPGARAAAVGDFNGDGSPDLAVSQGGGVSVLFNQGDGTFAEPAEYGTGDFDFIVAGDLDGDSELDLAVSDSVSGGVVVLENDGAGAFTQTGSYPPGGIWLDLGDLDGDGDLDVAVLQDDAVTFLLNDGGGGLSAGESVAIGGSVTLALGDLDGDDDLDVAVGRGNSEEDIYGFGEPIWGDFVILLGHGDGSFDDPVSYPTYSPHYNPYGSSDPGAGFTALGDMDGDQDLDVVSAVATTSVWGDICYPCSTGFGISVIKNRGDGTFGDRHEYDLGIGESNLWLGDIDLDGDLDATILGLYLFNHGDATFFAHDAYGVEGGRFVAGDDLDRDGDPDLVVVASSGVSVYRNHADVLLMPPPSFTSPECGDVLSVEPGETVEFTVTAEDAPERAVTLDASGLPSGAIMDPALPITGNPVSSHFSWTTNDSHNNTGHIVEFTATNDAGLYARCRVGIEVGDYTLVTLTSFTAIPGDGQVTLHWTTASEIDNAGFYLLRSTVATRGTVRLHKGLIPAMGDVFTGADYTFVDETAVNGVEYEYTLVDVDLYGTETHHPPVRAIPNPPSPPVKLLSPVYGATLTP